MQLLTLAKRFILKINTREDGMVVIEVGYNKFCLPRDKALQLVEMLEQAEVYEAKY